MEVFKTGSARQENVARGAANTWSEHQHLIPFSFTWNKILTISYPQYQTTCDEISLMVTLPGKAAISPPISTQGAQTIYGSISTIDGAGQLAGNNHVNQASVIRSSQAHSARLLRHSRRCGHDGERPKANY
jgi:hypothetical protein